MKAEKIDLGGWMDDGAEKAVGPVEIAIITRYPEAFRALVNECNLAPRTAVAVLAAYHHRWMLRFGRACRWTVGGLIPAAIAWAVVAYLSR